VKIFLKRLVSSAFSFCVAYCVGLEVGIQAPDLLPYSFLGLALIVGECIKLMKPAVGSSRKFNRLLEFVVAKEANWSLPICVQKPLLVLVARTGIVNGDPIR
jgi:hypothetical protein